MTPFLHLSILLSVAVLNANCRYAEQHNSGRLPDIQSPRQSVDDCTIAINGDLPEPQPLFIIPGTQDFFHPHGRDGFIRLRHRETIELYCSHSFVAPFNAMRTLLAACSHDNQFLVNGKTVLPIFSLRCTRNVVMPVARATQQPCGHANNATHHNNTIIEIAYELSATRRLPLMWICHDTRQHRTLYTQHFLSAFNVAFQRSVARPRFVTGPFFDRLPVNQLYTISTQMQTIGSILGAERIASVFDVPRSVFLARGHLAARVDYIFGTQQRGTFHFVNAAPQWQSFNAGNWEAIESDVRQMVANRRLNNVTVYTGTWQVLRLPDVAGVARELFLGFDDKDDGDKDNANGRNGRGMIPVPAFYYKVVVDMATSRGVVLVGVNNPHATRQQLSDGGEYRLCPDVSHRIGRWMRRWQPTVVRRGFSYACDVNDFREVVNELPSDLRTTGLLE